MFKKCFFAFLLSSISLFGHGLFYDVVEGGVSVHITSANNISISDAKVKVFAPGGNLPYAKGYTDINGNFAFMPDSAGKWHVIVTMSSDHGNHEKEFNIELSDDYKVIDFDKLPVERYLGILSALGILFGIFGAFSFFQRKKS
ncbi:MAG: carboxypeptidase-like regulatory domain-containing protein [Halarcobacter sp.]